MFKYTETLYIYIGKEKYYHLKSLGTNFLVAFALPMNIPCKAHDVLVCNKHNFYEKPKLVFFAAKL